MLEITFELYGLVFYKMGGNQGPEWDFVEEVTRSRHTSHVRCKMCGHEFHGSATHI